MCSLYSFCAASEFPGGCVSHNKSRANLDAGVQRAGTETHRQGGLRSGSFTETSNLQKFAIKLQIVGKLFTAVSVSCAR